MIVFVLILFLIIAACMPHMPARMATHMPMEEVCRYSAAI